MPAPTFAAHYAEAVPELTTPWQPTLPSLAEGQRPEYVVVNDAFAAHLGIDPDWVHSESGLAVLGARQVLPGSSPVAQAYAGHQFGGFSPLLGDGRAVLLGELTPPEGDMVDLALKGSGRTPFSRGGDGRAALGPVLREYLFGEAMTALGIPSTRALAAVRTGDGVFRDGAMAPGAVLARVAASHIRIGTFEVVAHSLVPRLREGVFERLLTHTCRRHAPHLLEHAPGERALALLEHVVEAQARLVAQWMSVGFLHGVLNTDNTAISGETLDYGPCAWLEEYHEGAVFSSIDTAGRYRFGAQPEVLPWNLARFAEALLAGSGHGAPERVDEARDVVAGFAARYRIAWTERMRAKLGLSPGRSGAQDRAAAALIDDLLAILTAERADLTRTFRALAFDLREGTATSAPARHTAWWERWQAALVGADPRAVAARMDAVNPVYVLRNHLVEEAVAAAAGGDLAPFDQLREAVSSPYVVRPGLERCAEPAPPGFTQGHVTYCGT